MKKREEKIVPFSIVASKRLRIELGGIKRGEGKKEEEESFKKILKGWKEGMEGGIATFTRINNGREGTTV